MVMRGTLSVKAEPHLLDQSALFVFFVCAHEPYSSDQEKINHWKHPQPWNAVFCAYST